MEYIKKEELIEGEIYYVSTNNYWIIGKVTLPNNGNNNGLNLRGNATYISKKEDFNIDKSWCYKASDRTYRLATSEEKHWLETCITADKFITFEEAMKTFISEYYEYIHKEDSSWKIGKIYKVNNDGSFNFESGRVCEYDNYYKNSNYFKPSTKEAYDAQFVGKEPEFVLPEKWCILRTGNNYNIINKWFQDNNLGKPYTKYGYIWKSNTNYATYLTKPERCTEITFEQFKKYVLKEEIVEEKVIEPLPQFKIIETIETITKVENNEGNQFFIGDVVKTEAGLHFKIIGFKYNENKTKILAIATDNYPEVVKDINDIEHYIEPKVEETLLEKAKKLYPVGTKFINPNDNRECVIKEKGNYFEGNNHNIYHSIANRVFKYEEGFSGCIYINNTWSKIIE